MGATGAEKDGMSNKPRYYYFITSFGEEHSVYPTLLATIAALSPRK